MRLTDVEKGDGILYRILIPFISMVSGMRLPDAARIVMYHQDFYGKPMASWTHATMRGKSDWTVGERELIAAMVAEWNACPFCIDAHSSIAALELGKPLVKASLENFKQADISAKLSATLAFLEKLSKTPDNLSSKDIQAVFEHKVTTEALEDAMAVTALFAITVRCANAFNFMLLNNEDSAKAAKRMLKKGYEFGKSKDHERPDHYGMSEILGKRVLDGPGITDASLRQAISKRATGGSPLQAPYDELALKTGEGAYRITDELVKKLVIKSGSEKAAFELIITAAVSAGLYRWNIGISILEQVH